MVTMLNTTVCEERKRDEVFIGNQCKKSRPMNTTACRCIPLQDGRLQHGITECLSRHVSPKQSESGRDVTRDCTMICTSICTMEGLEVKTTRNP